MSCLFLFIFSSANFLLKWKHVMSALILLEFMAVSSFCSMTVHSSGYLNKSETLMFLTILVCSSVLGLSTLILFVRSRSTEMLPSQNISKW